MLPRSDPFVNADVLPEISDLELEARKRVPRTYQSTLKAFKVTLYRCF